MRSLNRAMFELRIDVWAKLLTGYCVDVKPGDRVAISGEIAAEPLLRAVYREVINASGLPVMIQASRRCLRSCWEVAPISSCSTSPR